MNPSEVDGQKQSQKLEKMSWENNFLKILQYFKACALNIGSKCPSRSNFGWSALYWADGAFH